MDKKNPIELNSQQQQAVNCVENHSIILAGAGSGKTRVLIAKVINLIKNYQVDPKKIVMITFTNKAASEMKNRIGEKYQLGFIGTFHSFGLLILKREGRFLTLDRNFVIYDENDQLSLIKLILKEKKVTNKYSPSYYLNKISAAKNLLITPENYLLNFNHYNNEEVYQVYDNYQKELEKNKALDFDDLINLPIKLFLKNNEIKEKYQKLFPYILVDEFQDTNYSQYQLLKLLTGKSSKITVVGDFSQSIYSWRGAEIENLNRFQKDFQNVKTFHLEENYRSTQKILDFAYKIISKNTYHPVLQLYTKNNQGEEIDFYEANDEEDEAYYIVNKINSLKVIYDLKDMAVLYRTNVQSRIIEEVFLNYGLPYVLIGGVRFYERKEIKDILSYLRLLINPLDKISLERVIKIGKTRFKSFQDYYKKNKDKLLEKPPINLIEEVFSATKYLDLYNLDDEDDYSRIENIKELKSVAASHKNLTDFLYQVSLVESEYFQSEKKSSNHQGVKLMTLHQSKGLEFSVVFIAGVEEGILPHSQSLYDPFSIEEERRLFYVGITRAKKKLFITYTTKRFIFGSKKYSEKSTFLKDLEV